MQLSHQNSERWCWRRCFVSFFHVNKTTIVRLLSSNRSRLYTFWKTVRNDKYKINPISCVTDQNMFDIAGFKNQLRGVIAPQHTTHPKNQRHHTYYCSQLSNRAYLSSILMLHSHQLLEWWSDFRFGRRRHPAAKALYFGLKPQLLMWTVAELTHICAVQELIHVSLVIRKCWKSSEANFVIFHFKMVIRIDSAVYRLREPIEKERMVNERV